MHSERERNLFCRTDWFSVAKRQTKKMESDIDNIEGNRLLNTSVDDLCDFFESEFRIDVPELHEDQISVGQREVQIDISQNRMRYISDRGRPFIVPGTLIEISVPFSGEKEIFHLQPTTHTLNPPKGEIRDNELIIYIQGTDLEPQQVKSRIESTIKEIMTHLDRLRGDARRFNLQIRGLAERRINERRQKLLADRNLVASLGFQIKERSDVSKTFTASNVRKQIAPKMPSASTHNFKPEPELDSNDYEHILSVMTRMSLVMERSPSAFSTMKEEALRSHFLVHLNGHYEGQATGETFNYEGKTDILIRENGKNIFIAECKFWSGPKKFSQTIDQLLGYLSWRDTKTAIVVFNRNKHFSQVIEAIPGKVKAHPNFKRFVHDNGEGRSRYVLAHRDDRNREILLTVIVFDVPRRG